MIQLHQFHVRSTVCDHAAHPEEHKRTPAKGYRRTKSHQRIHIRTAMEQTLESRNKEILVDQHHRDRQQHLCQRQTEMIMHKIRRQRPAPHVVAHRNIHKCQHKADRQNQPPLQLRRRRILKGILFGRKLGRLTLSGFGLSAFYLCRVTGIFYCLDNVSVPRITFHRQRIGKQRNDSRINSGNRTRSLFHTRLAGGTGHASDNVLLHKPLFSISSASSSVPPAHPGWHRCHCAHPGQRTPSGGMSAVPC